MQLQLSGCQVSLIYSSFFGLSGSMTFPLKLLNFEYVPFDSY